MEKETKAPVPALQRLSLWLIAGVLLPFPVFAAASSDAATGDSSKSPLQFTVGKQGLTSLSFKGVSFLSAADKGDLRPLKVLFGNAVAPKTYRPGPPDCTQLNPETVRLDYPWASITCKYERDHDVLRLRLAVTNRCDQTLSDLAIQLAEINFPAVPAGKTLDAGMFGYGFKGKMSPLWKYPMVADPTFQVPLVCTDYGTGSLDLASDDLRSVVSVPYTTNKQTKTAYPFLIRCKGGIAPSGEERLSISLRFGEEGASTAELAKDTIAAYRRKYPFQVKWSDHRPIGAIYLASSGIKVPANPRRWILNNGKLDVSTDEGKQEFRTALLKLADQSIKILKDVGAQGMITWDPEGQQYLGACYYGDPRLTPRLAPEMEYKGSHERSTVDEYFKKFRDAGLKVGVCIRPQQITFTNGKPRQEDATDSASAGILESKIAYAKRHWGCSLFYIDSTIAKPFRPLDPDVFRRVANSYPRVLLMPENESMRYFAYSAPLNSYMHHRITSTPLGARTVYPRAFSVLLGGAEEKPEDHAALLASVKSGDILIFNSWYQYPGVTKLKQLYKEAVGQSDTHG